MPPPARASQRSESSPSEGESTTFRVPSSLKGKSKDASGPLQRGSAWWVRLLEFPIPVALMSPLLLISLACRKRKLKCDAAKPACQQCMRAGHAHECSYDNGKALSKTQILQRRIAQLEDKLSQLQGKSVGSPSSTHSFGSEAPPPVSPSGSRDRNSGFRSPQDDVQDSAPPYPRVLTDPTNDFPQLSNQLPNFTPSLYPDSHPSSTFGTTSPDNSSPWPPNTTIDYRSGQLYSSPSASTFNLDDPVFLPDAPFGESNWSLRGNSPSHCIPLNPDGQRYLLSLFLPFRRRCYFDIHVPRFLLSLESPDPKRRPHPCLMDAIYLLGCYISKNDELRQHEPLLLSRARQGLSIRTGFGTSYKPPALLHFIYIRTGASSKLITKHASCGLHQISSPFWPESARDRGRTQAPWTVTNMSIRRAGSMLDPPKDQIEVGERILAFWHVFLLDRCGSIMTNLPAALPDECDSFSQIETVWPRTLEEYQQGQVYEADYGTVRFLYSPDTPATPGRSDTIFTLRLKASALFERASRLGGRYFNTFLMGPEASSMSENLWALFRSVDFAISRFSSIMGEITPPSPSAPVNPQLVFIHTLALSASMRLHYVAAMDESISYGKRLRAAEATVIVANELIGSNVDFAEFDMLLGHCWKSACDVLTFERTRLISEADIAAIDAKIDALIMQMRALESVFPLTGFQITEVLQARQATPVIP
ncbi:hypothetical protein BS47DRAFT_1357085 [Hydnum rufescens UP504]|uniref:Zn(2)-C6 fungal-type domain-containing protein n=1 Tax=Hydnum rufescens UP504 TaxID=1448309 RepID=A0A9P6BBC9_9AGAM|nr:hypothetical protein BS47DRAFT_1357085 [Hydnum rufescens UP504]